MSVLEKLSPPTDNLYKFMAIAGLAGTITSVIWFVQHTNAVLETQYRAADVLHVAWLEAEDSTEAKKLLNARWKAAQEGESVFGLSIEAGQQPELSQEARDAVRSFEVAGETLARSIQEYNFALKWLGGLTGVSLGLMVLGFFFWWLLTQRHQDALLAKQANAPAHMKAPTKWRMRRTPKHG